MGVFEHFPYTNFHDINLDRILERTKEAEEAIGQTQDALDAAVNDMHAADLKATLALNTANAAANTANQANTKADTALEAYKHTYVELSPNTVTQKLEYPHTILPTEAALLIKGIREGTVLFSIDATYLGYTDQITPTFSSIINFLYDEDYPGEITVSGTFMVITDLMGGSEPSIVPVRFKGTIDGVSRTVDIDYHVCQHIGP